MSDEQSWDITPREYAALARVRRESMMLTATLCSMYANVHFIQRDREGRPQEPPFEADHFLGVRQRITAVPVWVEKLWIEAMVSPNLKAGMPEWYNRLMEKHGR